MQSPLKIARSESSIDWVQFTYPSALNADDGIRDLVYAHQDEIEHVGHFRKDISVHGYFGSDVGGASWLYNAHTQRAMVKYSGDSCIYYSNELHHRINPAELKYTRIDLQVTVWYYRYEPDLAKMIADKCRVSQAPKRRVKMSLIDGLGNGDTFYVGSPASDRRLRVYDKQAESNNAPDYTKAWRYEVQFRDAYAQTAILKVGDRVQDAERLAELVCTEFNHYDILVLPDVYGVRLAVTHPTSCSVDRRRAWLHNNIAPSIRDLAMHLGWDEVNRIIKGE